MPLRINAEGSRISKNGEDANINTVESRDITKINTLTYVNKQLISCQLSF